MDNSESISLNEAGQIDAELNKSPDPRGEGEEWLTSSNREVMTGSTIITDSSSGKEESYDRCGYGKWRPGYLQMLNSPNCLVAFMGMYSLVLGFIVNGIQNVNISTLERRFDLPSTSLGFISSSYDVSAAILAVAIGYYGSGKRKARLLSIAILLSAVGSFIMALPHFVTGKYLLGIAKEKVCLDSNIVNATCTDSEDSYLSNFFYVFLFAQLLHGIGGTTLFTVGVSLIDDSVVSKKTPMYLGILYGCNMVGSGLGYIVGGQLLNIYIDFDVVETPSLTPDDPRWLGAWWLSPTIVSLAQLFTCIPISLFGSELPGTKEVMKNRVNMAHSASNTLPSKLKDYKFMANLLTILRNPCFVFISLAMTCEAMLLSGSAAFLPKFVENEFGITISRAAILTGAAVVPAAALGLILGGYIAKLFNLTIVQSIKLCIIVSFVSGLCCSIVWIGCKPSDIYGVTVPYSGVKSSSNLPVKLTAPCNDMCQCDTHSFEPVCNGETGIYFSACYAGCTSKEGNKVFDCACVDVLEIAGNESGPLNKTLNATDCREPCKYLYLFMALLFVVMCISLMIIAPGDSVQLRCVLEEHKVFAQGIKTLVVRMLGSFIGPILMGKIMDLSCDIWREDCGHRLSCWIYHSDTLVLSVYLWMTSCKGLSLIFCSLALKFYQPPKTNTVLMVEPPNPPKVFTSKTQTYDGIAETTLDTTSMELTHFMVKDSVSS